jgi:hypothetical protein
MKTVQDFEYPFHLPNDWNHCINFIDENMGWWSEALPSDLEHLWVNHDFLKTALDIFDGDFFDWGPPRNEVFILESLKQFPDITQNRIGRNIPLSWWRKNPDFVSKLIENNYSSYRNAPKKLRGDKSFALNAASINGAILEFSPRVIRNDLEIASAALNSNPFAIHFLTKATRSAMYDSLIESCLKIYKGSKEEIFKIKNKQVITNLYVSLMNKSKAVKNYRVQDSQYYRQSLVTYPFGMDFDIFLYAININPELISYVRTSHLEELGNLLNQSLTMNAFINVEQIQKVQSLIFETYIERTKDLDFLNPLESVGYAKRISGL